ncbi:aminotransferase [Tianweitania sp. BSSL-BM11]|uniref:Glutamine--fructose-6-phosphate aminotransferase [isomerizing] n=1 Tax=Tianweitania aestuarii TaxID=2814886 RepID=A0ABS5RYS6_9HYPH|nr:aminotransferase [Tianweitania aestuarii]MBS9721925.1 aminotransferase [Tianweitania aestuarii]
MAELPGLTTLRAEMARQFSDGLQSHALAHPQAVPIAARIRQTGKLLMLGMGASHWANRMALASYREAGIDAAAEVLSEAMRAPQPDRPRVTLLTSQSGNSGEIAAYLERIRDHADHVGLTLNADSTLGRAVPCLIGQGGREQAFAATRSILLTLCLHAAILQELGINIRPLLDLLETADPLGVAPPPEAIERLRTCSLLVLSGRAQPHSALEAAGLTFTELARTPSLALELGQLLHGPMEMLGPDMALVLVRPTGGDTAAVTRVAEAALSYGLTPILFDLGAHSPVNGAITIALPDHAGLCAVATLLPAVQRLAIEAAAARIGEGFGSPLRSTKVTNGEAP